MKSIYRALCAALFAASLCPTPAFALTGVYCVAVDSHGNESEGGFHLEIRGIEGRPGKVKYARMSDPGHEDISLVTKFYELRMEGYDTDIVRFVSDMTYRGTRNSHTRRIVTMSAKYDKSTRRTWKGAVNVTYFNLKAPQSEPVIEAHSVHCDVK